MVDRSLKPDEPFILGLWDGHDSGAALLHGRRIVFAINEERLTRRKLEVLFPRQSIQACLRYAGIGPDAVRTVAYSTTDFAKTLTRLFPALKDEYYHIRRRKIAPTSWTVLKKQAKYEATRFFPSRWTRSLSDWKVRRELEPLGLAKAELRCLDHHLCHAAGALYSGFDRALVVTLDGIGDGLSGSVYRFEEGELHPVSAIGGDDSFGLFYEHVTNLMNMRELEDEGKVMALADYAYPVDDRDNPMLSLLATEGSTVRAACSPLEMHRRLKKILWNFPAEQFCFMAQRTLERRTVELFENLVQATGVRRLVISGGVASNIKMNRRLRNLTSVEDLFVFPHMGDGGQALGAASYVASQLAKEGAWDLQDLRLGPEYSDADIESVLRASGLAYEKPVDIAEATALLLKSGEIVFWFQGRMELGPRALGARSILALPNSQKIKDDLNLKLKKRVWYQPFCPSMLEEDARELLEDFDRGHPDRYMTNAYQVKEEHRPALAGVLNVDGTCRPQIVGASGDLFARLLKRMKGLTGRGVLLNTSQNIHGEPLACSPEDSIRALKTSGARYLAIGSFLVRKE